MLLDCITCLARLSIHSPVCLPVRLFVLYRLVTRKKLEKLHVVVFQAFSSYKPVLQLV